MSWTCIAPLLAALLQPTPETQTADDLRALADRVEHEHRGDTAGKQLDEFRAALVLQELGRDADQRIEAEVDIRYLRFQREGSDRDRDAIRYRVVGASQRNERGRDADGRYWGTLEGNPVSLHAKEMETDLAAAKRDLRLARQMLRFLDPGAVLRALQNPTPVTEESFQLGRTEPIECLVVSGTTDSFPLRSYAGEERPVRLKVYVEKATARLVAVEAWPLDSAEQPISELCELVRLADHDRPDGVLLPTRITHFVGPAGRRNVVLRATLNTIDLSPGLKLADFERV